MADNKEASKKPEALDKKPAVTDKKVDPALIKEMMFAPTSGGEGSISLPDEAKAIKEEEASKAAKVMVELSNGEIAEKLGKYKDAIIDKAKKDPSKFEVETERGWMNLREAIEQGWNPKTGKFDGKPIEKVDREGELSKLPPGERARVEEMLRRPEERGEENEEASEEGGEQEANAIPEGQANANGQEENANAQGVQVGPGQPNNGAPQPQLPPELMAAMGGGGNG